MPVFKSGKELSTAWCEMEFFEIIKLPAGAKHTFARIGQREKLVIEKGVCAIQHGDMVTEGREGANLDLEPGENFIVKETLEDAVLLRVTGRWGKETGGSGLFTFAKNDTLDNHFHDCDEYWIFFSGCADVVSEGREYRMAGGECLATGMGWHHVLKKVLKPVSGFYFETTMEGQKRPGHLWEHVHGKAEPKKERV